MSLANCHPFQRRWRGQTWMFAGNGHLHDFQPALDEDHRPQGSTDTERAFCHLMLALRRRFGDEGEPLPWQALAPALAELHGEVARHGTATSTPLLSNGEALIGVTEKADFRLPLLHRQRKAVRRVRPGASEIKDLRARPGRIRAGTPRAKTELMLLNPCMEE